MPSGNGLGLAAGIAGGVDAFTRSFIQTRQLKNQEKLQKNMVVVDLLMNQLRDPNTTYYQRAKIIDQIPGLIGAKIERPLTHILGYDKLNEEDFVLEEGAAGVKSKQGTNPQTVVDENVSDPAMASSVNLRGTEATSNVPGIAPITTKYGNLSPAQIKLKEDLAAQRMSNVNDVEKQAAILRVNYTLQSELLGKNGYSQEVFRGYDPQGNYIVTKANSQGQTKTINLGPVKSEAIKKAEITGANKGSSGRLGQLTTAQQTVAAYESDPSSVPEPNYIAAKKLLDDFEQTGQLKEAQTANFMQGLTGTKPISPAQITNNQQEDQRTFLSLQAAVDAYDSDLFAATDAVVMAESEVNDFYNIQIQPIKDRMKEWLDEGGDKEDKEYRDLQNQLRMVNSQHSTMKGRLNATKTRKTALESKKKAAEKRLNSFKPSTGAATSQLNSVDDDVNQYKNLIDAFKTDNASNPKAKGLSDRQILKILKDARRIP